MRPKYTYIQVSGAVQSTVMSTFPLWEGTRSIEIHTSLWKPESDAWAMTARTGSGVMTTTGGRGESPPHPGSDETAAIGDIVGPAFDEDQIVGAVETVVDVYLEKRTGSDEPFIDTYRRIGIKPFKEKLYATH